MITRLPHDITAETLLNYLPSYRAAAELRGTHKRSAYEDILSISDDGKAVIELSRNGLYDILPEALFHPIDRFDNLPANEYKERFAEEYEAQQLEEANARKFFAPFDNLILGLNCEVSRIKNECYGDNSILCDIICDTPDEKYRTNRFIRNMMPFVPLCRKIRGDRTLITVILRKILSDEGFRMEEHVHQRLLSDDDPRYNCRLGVYGDDSDEIYAGSEYIEDVTEYEITYWNEDECGESFLAFVAEMEEFEDFINDYFVGIESKLRFNISAKVLPTRLSDDLYYNYLDYNTNL